MKKLLPLVLASIIGAFASIIPSNATYFPQAFNKSSICTSGTSPCSFVVPANLSVVYVEAWGPGGGGAGGGGGSGNGATPGGGGGGAGGASGQFNASLMRVTPGETLTITVPAGGAGGNGGNGGNNATGSDGSDGTDASDTTIVGALQTVTAKGGRGTSSLASPGVSTPRGKGGTATAGGAAGTVSTAVASQTSSTGGVNAYGNTASAAAPGAGGNNANGGGGGQGGGATNSVFGVSFVQTAAQANASGTTGGTADTRTLYASRDFLPSGSVKAGDGGNGNGTNAGTQGTDTSAMVGQGGTGGGGGGGITTGGQAGAGANGRQGGPGYVIIYYTSP